MKAALWTARREEVVDGRACVSDRRVEARSLRGVAGARGGGWVEGEGRWGGFGSSVGLEVVASFNMGLETEGLDEGSYGGGVC